MTKPVRIALDAMGGDHGPEVIVPGAARALRMHRDAEFVFFGDAAKIRPLLALEPELSRASHVHHTDVSVRMDAKPSQALRAGRRTSSMWLAIEAVKKNEADVAVSAGNTGALMAMAKTCLHMMPPIGRPAIAAVWPTLRGQSIVLDLGATIGGGVQHLVDLAVMGSEMARIVLGVESPAVGLLNIGVEEVKGNDEVKLASQLLRERKFPNFAYHGFVEGDGIGKGTVDVVVTEGFTGNIALKAAEGTASQMGQYLRAELSRDFLARLGYFFARHALEAIKAKLDTRNVNGGVFLGLNGLVIKSHGGSDAIGTARAVETGYIMARNQLLSKIRKSLPLAHPEIAHTAALRPETSGTAPMAENSVP